MRKLQIFSKIQTFLMEFQSKLMVFRPGLMTYCLLADKKTPFHRIFFINCLAFTLLLLSLHRKIININI